MFLFLRDFVRLNLSTLRGNTLRLFAKLFCVIFLYLYMLYIHRANGTLSTKTQNWILCHVLEDICSHFC